MFHQIRVARPVRDLERSATMYERGLGLTRIGHFENHDGFDGVMLGGATGWHLEFTVCRMHPVTPAPTVDDLLVLYFAARAEWASACNAMLDAGFLRVPSFNPYWDVRGATFEDPDGYRVVLQQETWRGDIFSA